MSAKTIDRGATASYAIETDAVVFAGVGVSNAVSGADPGLRLIHRLDERNRDVNACGVGVTVVGLGKELIV